MSVAAVQAIHDRLMPALSSLRDTLSAKSAAFAGVVKIGRTHLQDATPLTFGQEASGWAALLERGLVRLRQTREGLNDLPLGGTAVGTGLNAHPEFAARAVAHVAELTALPVRPHPNPFAGLSAHDEIAAVSAGLRTLAGSLHKIADDVRLLASGPRCGLGELLLPENEPGSSIMPGKVNPTQCEALAMIAVQVMSNDVAVGFGGAGGHLEMNVYKPLMIANIAQSITILADGSNNFRKFLVEGAQPNCKKIAEHVERSLMLVTALVPVIGYDKAAAIAHYAMEHDQTLKEAALEPGFVDEKTFDRVVDPKKMVNPYVAAKGG